MKRIQTRHTRGITLLILLMALFMIAAPVLTQARSPFAETGKSSGAVILEDTPSWETRTPIPEGRVFHATVADRYGHVYVIGGTSDSEGTTPTDTIYQYETSNDTWATLTPMSVSMDSISGAEINGKIYIPGDARTADTYVYSIATDSWAVIPANGGYTARSQYSAVAVGKDLVVLGGIVASASASTTEVWVLDTETETWSAGVSMQATRTSFAAGAVGNTLIAAGGVAFPGFSPEMSVEVFDGTEWSYVSSIPSDGGTYTRWSYMAGGTAGDRLWLAAGRRDANWGVLDHAGYYDLSEDTWTVSPDVPALAQARVYLGGAVARDGYFYALGGRDGAGSVNYATNERLYVGGQTGSLEVTITPEDAVNAGAQWSMDGGTTWYDSGAEIALEPGMFTVDFKDVYGWDTPASLVDVAVLADRKTEETGTYTLSPIAVTGVSLNTKQLDLTVGGEKGILTATVLPENADNKNVFWSSSDESVALVNANSPAEVTPLAVGTAVITVTTEDGEYTSQCTVVVSAAPADNGNGEEENGDKDEELPHTGLPVDYLTLGLFLAATGWGLQRKK